MRQRIKLAHALCHDPRVVILDEPLNGLDPMARAEVIAIFQDLAAQGRHLIISSHILHEVDMISDTVIFLDQGYVVAEGDVQEVRGEMDDVHPLGLAAALLVGGNLSARPSRGRPRGPSTAPVGTG